MLTLAALALATSLAADPQIAAPEACPPPPPCPACPACPAPAAAPSPAWTGSVGFGLIAVTGNARSLTATLAAAAEYKAEDWIFGGRLTGTYGEARAAATGITEVAAENAALFLRVDRRFSKPLSAYLLAGFETDHPKSIEIRYSQELGAAYAWIDWIREEQKMLLRTDLGFRLGEEYRFQYFPTSGAVTPRDFFLKAPRAAVAFRYELNKTLFFAENLEVMPNIGDPRWMVNSITKVGAKLFGPMALGLSYTVNYDSAPPNPKIPWDTILAITLDYVI